MTRSEAEKLIAELSAGLEGVTPGPWTWGQKYVCRREGEKYTKLFNTPNDEQAPEGSQWEIDAAHIARCSPDNILLLLDTLSASLAETERLKKALRNIAEGNLGDDPWQANYAKIREVAARALSIPTDVPLSRGGE